MMVKVIRGAGFRGCVAYLQNGKKERDEASPERVGWTETRNLLSDDLTAAAREMGRTARDAELIKTLSGNASTAGRKGGGKSVAHLILSWSDQDEITDERQREAVDSLIKTMGFEGLQAAIIQHRDTDNAHVHVVLNRVDPNTGRTNTDTSDAKKLQKWAAQWERDHPDETGCKARSENIRQRSEGERVEQPKDARQPWQEAQRKEETRDPVEEKRTAEHTAAREPQDVAAEMERLEKQDWRELYGKQKTDAQAQFMRQRQEQDAVWKAQRAEVAREKAAIEKEANARREAERAQMKPAWASVFRKQRAEERAFADMGAFSRAAYYMRNLSNLSPDHRGGVLSAFFNDRQTMDALKADMLKRHGEEKRAVADVQSQKGKTAAQMVWARHRPHLDELHQRHDQKIEQIKAQHLKEREALTAQQAQERRQLGDQQRAERQAACYTRPQERDSRAQSAEKQRAEVNVRKAQEAARARAKAQERPAADRHTGGEPRTHSEPFNAAAERQRILQEAQRAQDAQVKEAAERTKATFAPAHEADKITGKFADLAKHYRDQNRTKKERTKDDRNDRNDRGRDRNDRDRSR